MTRARALVAGMVTMLAVAVAVAAAGSPSVTITSPKAGSTISAKRNPNLAIAGSATFAPTTARGMTFYLRRDDCGGSNDNPHLSKSYDPNKPDGGDGCGLLVNALVGAGGDADQAAFVDFPSTDGMPQTLNATKAITGVIDVDNYGGALGTGAITADVTLEALVNGNGVPVGSDSETVVALPGTAHQPIAFTIYPAAGLNGVDLSGLDLRVRLHGPYILSGFIATSGKSYVKVPSYSASLSKSVQVSIDDPGFVSPIATALNGSSWSVVVPTPTTAGKHTVYVKAKQGFSTSPVVSSSFAVK